MVATAKTSEVTKRAKAVSAILACAPWSPWLTATSRSAAAMTARMPTPDSGLLDDPISPAM